MRIDFICNDGSPIGVVPEDIYGKGVGGAELALLTLTEELERRGHDVWVYNNPRKPPDGSVKFATQQDFCDGHYADVLVVFRSPNPAVHQANAGRRVFWSCDQQTVGNFYKDIFPYVDLILTISPFHREYFIQNWKAEPTKTLSLDLGIRTKDYDDEVERIPDKLIFCSVPDRGLVQLQKAWRSILREVPGASLVITGDYTLWGAANPLSHNYRMIFAREPRVEYLGNIPRRELVRHQLQAQVLAFPCIYEELFCISVAECQVAGAFPVTSTKGALETTNEWGVKLDGDPETQPWIGAFVDEVVKILKTEDMSERRSTMMRESRQRFSIERAADDWEDLVL